MTEWSIEYNFKRPHQGPELHAAHLTSVTNITKCYRRTLLVQVVDSSSRLAKLTTEVTPTRMTISQIKKVAVPILNAHGIRKAAVFGSVARGEETAASDLDLLIELPKPIGLLPFVDLKLELEDALYRKVDLVEYEALHPRLRSRILADQIPI